MLKIRLTGTINELDDFVDELSLYSGYLVKSVSSPYENRDGKTFRVYIELEQNNEEV